MQTHILFIIFIFYSTFCNNSILFCLYQWVIDINAFSNTRYVISCAIYFLKTIPNELTMKCTIVKYRNETINSISYSSKNIVK